MSKIMRPVTANNIDGQRQLLHTLLEGLGEASSAEIEAALASRELVQPEDELPPEVVTHLQRRIQDAAKKSAS
ncbi:hypothetical protein ACQ4N7_28005 [Nodosilinea sp. AN01ver1]|uniref:hypothetical protein n=1 Tax=Nodosilinea sp. AN01ver1 TaxID=3423362 RepID=UPI003D314657